MYSNESWFWRCGRAVVSALSVVVDVAVKAAIVVGSIALGAVVVTGAAVVATTAAAAITGTAQTVTLSVATILAISTAMVFVFIVTSPTDDEEEKTAEKNEKRIKLFARTEDGNWLPVKAA